MWCINYRGMTLQEVLIMAYMNLLEVETQGKPASIPVF
jgi:hypothetical protein